MSRSGSKLPASADSPPATAERIAERITVTLISKVAAELQDIHDRTGMSKTDIVNRAITLYEFVEAELSAGAEFIVRRDGEPHRIKLI
jgi:hypothetical protein